MNAEQVQVAQQATVARAAVSIVKFCATDEPRLAVETMQIYTRNMADLGMDRWTALCSLIGHMADVGADQYKQMMPDVPAWCDGLLADINEWEREHQ